MNEEEKQGSDVLDLRILGDVIKHLHEPHASVCVVHCTGNKCAEPSPPFFVGYSDKLFTSQGMRESEKMYGAEMSKAP